MNFNFGEVLTRAWQIIWKHKVLWIFGILAGCGRGGGGNGGGGNSGGGGGNGGGFGQPDLPPQALQWYQWIENNLAMFFIVVCAVSVLIWLVTKVIGAIGKIGLIRGVAQVEGGSESLVFGQLFSESMPYLWRMFGLSLIPGLPFLIPIAIIVVASVMTLLGPKVSEGGALPNLSLIATMGPLAVGCICLLIPVMIVLYLIVYQSERAVVLEEMNLLASLSRGWEVFRKNLGPVILMAIILGVISFIIGLVIAIPVIAIVFPTMFAYGMGGAESTTPLIFMGVCMCLYIPIALVLQGIMVAYTESAWTLTYMQLTKPQDNAPVVLEANA